MSGYIANFTVYTLAMVGLIFFALFVFKKFSGLEPLKKNGGYLHVEESMNISPRKTIYVIRAGKEKFLIAGDVDKTTLISKLDDGKTIPRIDKDKEKQEELPNILDFEIPPVKNKKPVMKELARKLQQG